MEKTEPGSFQRCPVTGQEAMGTNEMQVVPSEHEKTLFYSEDDQAVAQVAQRGCGVCSFRDMLNRTGHGPAQPDLGDPA